jgi:hypothetical protein
MDKAIYKLINEILTAMNNKQIVGGIFCDLHCMHHGILFHKLEFYGITGKLKSLIEPYFNKCYHRVIMDEKINCNDIFSEWGEIKRGVPQGSILGPLLFSYT